MKKCGSCGKEVSPLASKCRFCGVDLVNQPGVEMAKKEEVVVEKKEEVINKERKNKEVVKKKSSLKTIAGICLIIIGVIGFILIRNEGGSSLKRVDSFLGSSKSEVISELGNPTNSSDGLLEYNDRALNFMLTSDERVVAITIFKNSDYFYKETSAKMSLSEIKENLSNPFYEGLDEENEMYLLAYQSGNVEAYYYFINDSKIIEYILIIDKGLIKDF